MLSLSLGEDMQRREFITLLGGATVAWPLSAHAQQVALPVVGFLSFRSEADSTDSVTAFRKGLGEVGYTEGRNVAVEYRWADARLDRLPTLAEELVRLPVLAAVGGQQTPRAAQKATKTSPIVFGIGEDPVQVGLVPDLNRPPGNMTGVTFLTAGLGAKRLGMLRQLVPDADVIGLLANQNSPQGQEQIRDVADAAKSLKQQLTIPNGSNDQEIEAAFASLAERRVKALLVAADPSYDPRRNRLIALSAQFAIPTLYHFRDFPLAGGLACYGASISDLYRQVGIYVGRILHGEKPADLPVMLPTKFEFVINLKTASALKLDIPPTMLALADEVIE
jgi:putative tryptophan/tyrosine transport system substrate-binding protein